MVTIPLFQVANTKKEPAAFLVPQDEEKPESLRLLCRLRRQGDSQGAQEGVVGGAEGTPQGNAGAAGQHHLGSEGARQSLESCAGSGHH